MTKTTAGIYTGADHVAFHYCGGMLLSLRRANDMGLPVTFVDFGLSRAQRVAIKGSGLVTEVIDIEPLLPESVRVLEQEARAKDAKQAIHLARAMKKIGIFNDTRYDQFLWCDVDTLWFGKVSDVIGEIKDGQIRAGRTTARDSISRHLVDLGSSSLSDLADSIRRRLPIREPFTSFNSGLFQMTRKTAAGLMEGNDDLIRDFGLSIFGDQALINLIASAQGIEIIQYPDTINFAVTRDLGERVSLVSSLDVPGLVLHYNGAAPLVYHFLLYKPQPGRVAEGWMGLIQRLFDSWHFAGEAYLAPKA